MENILTVFSQIRSTELPSKKVWLWVRGSKQRTYSYIVHSIIKVIHSEGDKMLNTENSQRKLYFTGNTVFRNNSLLVISVLKKWKVELYRIKTPNKINFWINLNIWFSLG